MNLTKNCKWTQLHTRIWSFASTSDTRRATLVTIPMIGHERLKEDLCSLLLIHTPLHTEIGGIFW